MHFKKLHILIFGVLLGFQSISSAQEIALDSLSAEKEANIAEQNNLKFQEHFFEALKQKSIKNYSKAIENLEKCYEIYDNDVAVEFEFSKNYYYLKKFDEAKLFINKALEKEAENVFLLAHKVEIFKMLRNYQDAIEIQKKINSLNPKKTDELVLLYIQNKQYSEAEKLITEVEKKALSSRRIKSFKLYIENRRKTLQKSNTKPKIKLNSASLENLQKEFQQKKDYKTLIKLLNKEIEVEQFKMADKDAKIGIELYPAQPVLYKINGFVLNKLGKYNDAIAVLTIGIDFVFDNNKLEAEFYNQFALSYEKLNKPQDALKYKKKAEALRKGN